MTIIDHLQKGFQKELILHFYWSRFAMGHVTVWSGYTELKH